MAMSACGKLTSIQDEVETSIVEMDNIPSSPSSVTITELLETQSEELEQSVIEEPGCSCLFCATAVICDNEECGSHYIVSGSRLENRCPNNQLLHAPDCGPRCRLYVEFTSSCRSCGNSDTTTSFYFRQCNNITKRHSTLLDAIESITGMAPFYESHSFVRVGGSGVPFVHVSTPCSATSFTSDALVVDFNKMTLVGVK